MILSLFFIIISLFLNLRFDLKNIRMKNSISPTRDILLFSLLLIFGCKKENDKVNSIADSESLTTVRDFPVSFKLEGKNVGPNGFFASPAQITFSKDRILIFDAKKEKILHLLNDKYEVINSFCSIGNGPEELPKFTTLMRNDFMNEQLVYFYNFPLSVTKISLQDSIGKVFPRKYDKLTIPNSVYNQQQLATLGAENFVGLGGMMEGKLCFFNLQSAKRTTPFTPKVDPGPKTREDKMFINNGKIAINPTLKKIAVSNHYFNQIEIYNYEGDLLKELRIGEIDSPFDEKPSKRKYYYADLYSDGEYIFAAYFGGDPNGSMNFLAQKKSEIHIFKWTGEPVAKLKLDRLIGILAVNLKKGVILSIDDFENEEQRLLEYKIPKEILDGARLE
jgi:hypothetical protein